jgi:hypothetical protein
MDTRGVWPHLIGPLGLSLTIALTLLMGEITPQACARHRPAASVPPPCARQIPGKTVIRVPACCDDFLRQVVDPPSAWQNAASGSWVTGQGGNTAPCFSYKARDRWTSQPGSRGRCGTLRFSVTFRATPKTKVLEWQPTPPPGGPMCREEARRFDASIAAHEARHVRDIAGMIQRVNQHWKERRRVDACGATPAEALAKARAASRRLTDAELERLNAEHLRLAEAFDASPEGRVYTPICQHCDACKE